VLLAIAATLCSYLALCGPVFAAGDVNSAGCPFESESSPGFRASLPDCRAFELVSPSFAGGPSTVGPLSGVAPVFSPDGEHLLVRSIGAFAETEELSQVSTEYGAVYELSRTPTGWTAEAQEPSASMYTWNLLEGFSDSALARSVWLVAAPVQPGELPETQWFRKNDSLYVLREGRGNFVPIGPAVAPGHVTSPEPKFSYVDGVSADVTHVLFTALGTRKQLWPGDSTEEKAFTIAECNESINKCRPSLYEYSVPGESEPVLVGVTNEGAAPWTPGAAHVNEGAHLVSECGTEYDGMSASGELVFSTAFHAAGCKKHQPEVSEVYARVAGVGTLDISEPSSEDCASCDDSDPASAAFAGASEDGSVVFFTSEQRLLGGASGNSLYEFDMNAPRGERVSLVAPDVTGVAAVAQDGGRVYFRSTAVLVAGANANGEAASGVPGEKLYVDNATERPGAPWLEFVSSGEDTSAFDATADGEFLIFTTATDLKGTDDTSSVAQLFEYDAVTGAVARVSSGQRSPGGYECPASGTVMEGYDCDGNTTVSEDTPHGVKHAVDSVSEAGTVVFTSELPLTPGAVQGRPFFNSEGNTVLARTENVYEFSAGQVYLISAGDEASPPYFLPGNGERTTRLAGIDGSGRDVFFESADSLVPQDSGSQASWYDARVGGGFPGPVVGAGCSGEGCQGAGPVAPMLGAPLAVPRVTENVAPAAASAVAKVPVKVVVAKCKKGYVKKKGKCVKERRVRKASVSRAAGKMKGRR
jgi:hypothetical protein